MSKPNLEGKIPLEAVLSKFKEHNKNFISGLEKEESLEKVETIDSIKNEIKATKEDVERKKNMFVNEIKTGLGQKVKANPNGITIIKKKWYQKLGTFLKNIFTRF